MFCPNVCCISEAVFWFLFTCSFGLDFEAEGKALEAEGKALDQLLFSGKPRQQAPR